MADYGIVIYGAAGCGKSRAAEALLRFFGRQQVLDGWRKGDELPADAVALTNQYVPGALQFEVVWQLLGEVERMQPAALPGCSFCEGSGYFRNPFSQEYYECRYCRGGAVIPPEGPVQAVGTVVHSDSASSPQCGHNKQ